MEGARRACFASQPSRELIPNENLPLRSPRWFRACYAALRTHRRRFGGGDSLAARARAIQRGTLVHRLLQSLPEVQPSRRCEIARTFLARNAETWSEAEREGLAANVLAVIAEPRFAPVFAARNVFLLNGHVEPR